MPGAVQIMGTCPCLLPSEERIAKVKSDRISHALRHSQVEASENIKLLLLGAGESGKSTIVKQMRIIHTSGFSRQDCLSFKRVLHLNLLESMQAILEAMDLLDVEFKDLKMEVRAQQILSRAPLVGDDLLSNETLDLLQILWKDEGVQSCVARSREYQLSDGASYLLDKISVFKNPDYVPTEQDILHIRVETKGIIEVKFTYKEADFTLYDVGGQRNQRRKWIHCFDDCTAIIFCASLSGYDMMLAEDGTTNRLHESLNLFRSICNSPLFSKTSMLLFLNKTDLLRKKIAVSPLTVCFPEYRGPQDYESAAGYIEMKFLQMNLTRDKDSVYVHHTCATDTSTIKSVFKVAAQAIMRENLQRCGLI